MPFTKTVSGLVELNISVNIAWACCEIPEQVGARIRGTETRFLVPVVDVRGTAGSRPRVSEGEDPVVFPPIPQIV